MDINICLSKCPDSICLEKCLEGKYDFSLDEKFFDILEKVLSKGIVVKGEVLRVNKGNYVEAVARVDEQTWLMHSRLPPIEGRCRKLRDIVFEEYMVVSKLCYEGGDYWLRMKYWRISDVPIKEFKVPVYVKVIEKLKLEDGQYVRVRARKLSLQELEFYIREMRGYEFSISTVSGLGIYSFLLQGSKYFMLYNKGYLLIFRDGNEERPKVFVEAIREVAEAIVKRYDLGDNYSVKDGDFGVEYYFPSFDVVASLRSYPWKRSLIQGLNVFVKRHEKKAWAFVVRDEFVEFLEKKIEEEMKEAR